MFKRAWIHSLTSVTTLCNSWQGKIPLARLSQPQHARSFVKCTVSVAVFPAAGDAKKGKFQSDHFFSKHMSPFFQGHYVQLPIHA